MSRSKSDCIFFSQGVNGNDVEFKKARDIMIQIGYCDAPKIAFLEGIAPMFDDMPTTTKVGAEKRAFYADWTIALFKPTGVRTKITKFMEIDEVTSILVEVLQSAGMDKENGIFAKHAILRVVWFGYDLSKHWISSMLLVLGLNDHLLSKVWTVDDSLPVPGKITAISVFFEFH